MTLTAMTIKIPILVNIDLSVKEVGRPLFWGYKNTFWTLPKFVRKISSNSDLEVHVVTLIN